jgi:hypothetical protein
MFEQQVGIRRGRESAASHHHEQYKAAEGLHELIGGTPLVHIKSLSEETGCKVGTTFSDVSSS